MGKTPQSPSSFSPSEIKSMTSEKKKSTTTTVGETLKTKDQNIEPTF